MLRELLAIDVFKLLLIMARLGAAIMFIPGLGGTVVSSRTRLLLTMLIALLMMPVLSPHLPPMPKDPMALFVLVLGEVTVGLFFGMLMQVMMSALDTAGAFIGYATGLTNAFVQDAVSDEQNGLITGFLNNIAITLLLLTDTHHLILRALVDSYSLFVPGTGLPMGDFSAQLFKVAGESFSLGMRLCAPLVVFSLVLNVALGLLNKLVPQMQVFFVGMPIQILVGLMVLMIALPPVMLLFMQFMGDGIAGYLAPE